jgi:hypothetical protein
MTYRCVVMTVDFPRKNHEHIARRRLLQFSNSSSFCQETSDGVQESKGRAIGLHPAE